MGGGLDGDAEVISSRHMRVSQAGKPQEQLDLMQRVIAQYERPGEMVPAKQVFQEARKQSVGQAIIEQVVNQYIPVAA